MRVVIRTDASIRIGTGHVIRCLTLADALRRQGAACRFICRALEGHMAAAIRARGFDCTLLPAPEGPAPVGPPDHAHWAGVDWRRDAEETRAALGSAPDWLVLDHYAFDARWEQAVCPADTRLLVLDDLADRPHNADLLVDQNLGRRAEDYDGLVPDHCKRLIGPRYALLRPEFAERRAEALAARAERADQGIRHLLISMGGVDLPDATSKVLEVLPQCNLPDEARITVVMGTQAPALERVRALAAALPWQADVRVNVSDMAALMADADLAIGAVGTSALERIALGLPSICVPIAQNQIAYANYIHQKKLGYSIFSQSDIKTASFHHAMRFAERCVPSIEESRASLIGEKTKSIYQTMREIYAF
jgi:UDP-2,4-diacetamido-2,4,6-trideoxy-beta-L-altropyranose hydrolase